MISSLTHQGSNGSQTRGRVCRRSVAASVLQLAHLRARPPCPICARMLTMRMHMHMHMRMLMHMHMHMHMYMHMHMHMNVHMHMSHSTCNAHVLHTSRDGARPR